MWEFLVDAVALGQLSSKNQFHYRSTVYIKKVPGE
jgi:hypothetical protein